MSEREIRPAVTWSPGLRSVLFVPGHQPELVAKLPRFQADLAVVDLEDATPEGEKAGVRALAVQAVAELAENYPKQTVYLRVNGPSTPWFADDVMAAAASRCAGLVLPKLEDGSDVEKLDHLLAEAGRPDLPVIAGLETVAGVARAEQLCVSRLQAIYFGAEDFITDLGGYRTAEGLEVLHARSVVSMSARMAGIEAIDQAVLDFRSGEVFGADARQGKSMGYSGKICIHPSQVGLAKALFTPTESEVAHAHRVLSAVAEGVAVVDGQMVDQAHARRAAAMLAALDGIAETAGPCGRTRHRGGTHGD